MLLSRALGACDEPLFVQVGRVAFREVFGLPVGVGEGRGDADGLVAVFVRDRVDLGRASVEGGLLHRGEAVPVVVGEFHRDALAPGLLEEGFDLRDEHPFRRSRIFGLQPGNFALRGGGLLLDGDPNLCRAAGDRQGGLPVGSRGVHPGRNFDRIRSRGVSVVGRDGDPVDPGTRIGECGAPRPPCSERYLRGRKRLIGMERYVL